MAATYQPPKLKPEKQRYLDQGLLDFMVPAGKTLNIKQVADALDRKRTFVQDLIDEGDLEVFVPPNREKERPRITRRSVLAVLIEQANFDPNDIVPRAAEIVATFTPDQYKAFLLAVTEKRSRVV